MQAIGVEAKIRGWLETTAQAAAMACCLRSALLLVVTTLCPLIPAVDDGYCGKKSGVVKNARSASLGAQFLAGCGRTLVLKYNIDSAPFYKVLQHFCLVTHLCYASSERYISDVPLFQKNLVECYRSYAISVARMRPDMIGHKLTTDIEEVTTELAECIQAAMPKDKDVVLGAVRYLRQIFFNA